MARFPKMSGIAHAEIQRDQPAQRRSAHAAVFRPRQRAVMVSHEGLEFLDQHLTVGAGTAATQPPVFDVGVLVDALHPSVVDSDNHKRFDLARFDQRICRLAHPPVVALDERGFRVEQVLAIVQIEHREEPVRIVVKDLGDVNDEVVFFVDQLRGELFMLMKPRLQAARR